MRQRRLEYYFISSKAPFIPSGRSFLHLPYSVRKLVYEFAELDQIFVDLNYSNLKIYPEGAYPETRDCRKLDTKGWYDLKKLDVPGSDEVWETNNEAVRIEDYGTSLWGRTCGSHQSMLLVSKQIHQEVEAFTYAGAVFRVCLGQPLGFTRLWRMNDHALSNLGSLTIRLDVPQTEVCNDGWADPHPPSRYLDFSTTWGRSVLKDWISTLSRLNQSIQAGTLRLRVIFCAKTMDDARAIVEPMIQLPQLKDCGICAELYGQSCWWILVSFNIERRSAIRPLTFQSNRNYPKFYRNPRPENEDTEISRLVQHVIEKLTHVQDQDSVPFRYLDLPLEIRFAILEYTDLVSPRAVQWRPSNWIKRSPSCTYCPDHGQYVLADELEPPCSCHCSPGPKIDDAFNWYRCCGHCRPEDHSGICYCSSRDSIWSSSCSCQYLRRDLFSVSRQVRQDAIAVYYAYNKILVTPYNSPIIRLMDSYDCGWPAHGIHFMPKIELSLYLSSIARNALQHIHWLEWILPTSQRTHLLPKTPAWFDYLDTLLLMENAMNISALTFTINISASGMTSDLNGYHHRMLLNEDAWKWYETIILPVRRLGEAGLKDFFVNLRQVDVEGGRRVHHEQDLERAVMGKGYNSTEKGKPAERTFWKWREVRGIR
jgi:hypothetical protein